MFQSQPKYSWGSYDNRWIGKTHQPVESLIDSNALVDLFWTPTWWKARPVFRWNGGGFEFVPPTSLAAASGAERRWRSARFHQLIGGNHPNIYRVSTCFNHPIIDDVHVCSNANQVLKVYDIWDVRNMCGDKLSMTLNRMVRPRMVGCPCRWLKHQSLQVWRSVSGQQMTPTRRYLGPVCKNGLVWRILMNFRGPQLFEYASTLLSTFSVSFGWDPWTFSLDVTWYSPGGGTQLWLPEKRKKELWMCLPFCKSIDKTWFFIP